MNLKFYTIIILTLLLTVSSVLAIDIVPSGSTDDTPTIQAALDDLQDGDTLRLNGDFVFRHTIYLPSNFTWILNGTLTMAGDAELDEVGWVDPPIDARRRTAITEKSGGATNIDMSGGTYYGSSDKYPYSMRLINFVSVTNCKFHDMHITEVTDDNFTIGPGSNNNELRNLIGSHSKGGNALTDKGDHNKWYDCIAEDCGSDGWTPKCRYSEFYRCIARRNEGPGFGMFCRIDGSGNPVDLGEAIENNKFFDCESYENNASGFSFNISSTSGEGGSIRGNFIQARCYDNAESGVRFRNKQPNSIIENNVLDIICYGNHGLNKSGDLSSYAGGVGTEGSSTSPVRGITGWVVCYDNGQADVNTNQATDCNIVVFNPNDRSPAVLKKGNASNILTAVDFNCSETLEKWCQQEYCGVSTVNTAIAEPPESFFLSQNFPNPFQETSTIYYTVPRQSNVCLKVYDYSGREIATLINEKKVQGEYELLFDGSTLQSGSYFYKIQTGNFAETKRFILIK
ncbi:MAG: T9SS type A sorting domain-containing protein [Bacteroidales bacterium]|jgi:hypothetical protein|nr:T9SS type A sorting domain-containing protein [Bacteroidales bacterium]